jgi:TonB family protein
MRRSFRPPPAGPPMRRLRRAPPWLLVLSILLLPAAPAASSQQPAEGKAAPAALPQALAEAERLLENRDYPAAVDAFNRASELAGGPCGGCMLGLSRAFLGWGHNDSAVEVMRQATRVLSDPLQQARAFNQLGVLLTALRPQADKDLAEAEEAFAQAIRIGGGDERAAALANLAVTRFKRARYPEAAEAARQSIREGNVAAAKLARVALCSARRAGSLPAAGETAASPANVLPPSPGAGPDLPRRVEGEVSKPVKIYSPSPRYSAEARRAKLEGRVIVEAVIDEEGCVIRENLLVRLDPGLDRNALDAVRQWVFEPALLALKPVKVYYTLTVNFQVQPHPQQ